MSFIFIFSSSPDVELDVFAPAHVENWRRSSFSFADCQIFLAMDADRWCGAPDMAGSVSDQVILGRIRLDRKSELRAALDAPDDAADHDLALRAYEYWGPSDFLQHLFGDFCFVIWDARSRTATCVRDQLGVRPLFYAHAERATYVSDDLMWIMVQSDVDKTLNDPWIYGFLTDTFGASAGSVFSNVKRLPPAHRLQISHAKLDLSRYWSLNVSEPLFLRRRRDYLDAFRSLTSEAISDRASPRTGVSMSGGLDSSTLAALASRQLGIETVAISCHYDFLVPDDENYFTSLIAEHLGIRRLSVAMDDFYYDPDWRDRGVMTAEPTSEINRVVLEKRIDKLRVSETPVWFYGEGPDNALTFEWSAYLLWLYQSRKFAKLSEGMIDYVRTKTVREWGATLLKWGGAKKLAPVSQVGSTYLDREFEAQMMAGSSMMDKDAEADHPWRPRAFRSFASPIWQSFFEAFDQSSLGMRTDWRHPFLDLRVLEFMLATPPLPWARQKRLIRKAMEHFLPVEITRRAKAPLRGDRRKVTLDRYPLRGDLLGQKVRSYVDLTNGPTTPPSRTTLDRLLKVHSLDYWLENCQKAPAKVIGRMGGDA